MCKNIFWWYYYILDAERKKIERKYKPKSYLSEYIIMMTGLESTDKEEPTNKEESVDLSDM